MLTIVSSSEIEKKQVEMLVIPVCEDVDIHPSALMPALLHQAGSLKEFSGADNEAIVFYAPSGSLAAQVMIIGLGKKDKLDGETLRSACGRAIKKCIQKEISEALFVVPFKEGLHIEPDAILEAMVEGALLGNYQFDQFKKPKHPSLLKIAFAVPEASVLHARSLSQRTHIICDGTLLAREWVITPSNLKRPEQFARSLVKAAEKENLKTEVLDQPALKKKKFGSLLAVSAGSDANARMVILEHDPGNTTQTIALVGKGVTFDSGGINLKSQGSIEDMKMDMAGAAAVAATMITAARLKLPVRLIGVLPLVENMPSGSATRPGDIVKSFSGKTIEINNTDAEGRLILADALSYVIQTYKPDAVVDLATLTGACVVALGERIAGVFSPDDRMSETLIASGRKTFERCWKMPLPEDYKDLLKSEFADICNITGLKWGGAITAALFLSEFTENTRWMHIDIAGPAYVKKETAYCGVGGTGFGVRLLCDWIEKMAGESF
ncbi:MAG: leucyl aminopeptidase [Pseudomonadota bacterium]